MLICCDERKNSQFIWLGARQKDFCLVVGKYLVKILLNRLIHCTLCWTRKSPTRCFSQFLWEERLPKLNTFFLGVEEKGSRWLHFEMDSASSSLFHLFDIINLALSVDTKCLKEICPGRVIASQGIKEVLSWRICWIRPPWLSCLVDSFWRSRYERWPSVVAHI